MKRTKVVTLLGFICLVLILSLAVACAPAEPTPAPSPSPAPSPAPAPQTAADFFANNTVTLLINSSPGGDTDYQARLFASFWGETTGKPMMVKNEPAGGGRAALNLVYGAKADGLTIGVTYPGSQMVMPTLMKDPAIQFDARKFSWIGWIDGGPFVLVVGKHIAAQSAEELQKVEGLRFLASSPDDARALDAVIVSELLGLKGAKVATGFRSADIMLVLMRTEGDALMSGCSASIQFITEGVAYPPFLALSSKRTQWFPDMRTITEIVKLTPEQEGMLKFAETSKGGIALFTAPGVPADRLEFLRGAFDKIMANEGYQTQLKRVVPILVPVKGVEIAKEVETGLSIPADVVTRIKELRDQKYLAITK